MQSTHVKGMIGEMEFTVYLLKKGFTVLKPINPNSSYDLVIEKNGKYSRIQVKYLTPRNGIMRVELARPKRNTEVYQLRGVDAMGVFDSINNNFYLIPIKDILNKSEIWIRVDKAKNNQSKNIHFAGNYSI